MYKPTCEYIGKVKLNYEFYSGIDVYSDGKIEDDLLKISMSGETIEDVLAKDSRWPVLYHFSPMREDIISWYDFPGGAEILEIGSGCGAVTGGLLKNTKVTCVELSRKRSLINANRHMNTDSLEIFVGNFNDIKFEQKFDFITLIGVFEYASLYTDDKKNPYLSFLANIKNFLKPGGKIIIAIENKYGLKYWAGAKEDHTRIAFEGLEGYKNTRGVRTFAKPELVGLLNNTGFLDIQMFYPYPDYKLPFAIYSDHYLPKAIDLSVVNYSYDSESAMLFNEQNVYDGLIEIGMFDFFSNSFLVIAS